MTESDRLTLEILIAIFVSLLITLPLTYFRTKELVKEGKSIKNLPTKISISVTLPIISIPILLSNIYWPWKIVVIVIAGLGGISYGIGIDAAQKGLRQLLGLPPIDENTGQIVKENDDKQNDKR